MCPAATMPTPVRRSGSRTHSLQLGLVTAVRLVIRQRPPSARSMDPSSWILPVQRHRSITGFSGPTLLRGFGPERCQIRTSCSESGTRRKRGSGAGWELERFYDWLVCERDHASGCRWNRAATSSDYVRFLKSTGEDGIWTFHVNRTAGRQPYSWCSSTDLSATIA